MGRVHIGCATWAVGAANDHLLPHAPGGNLARYAARLTAAEVNSSFHRRHRHATWGRWARSVGPSLRFSVKVPKTITHERRLVDVDAELNALAAEVNMLGEKRALVLVQLPPSLLRRGGVRGLHRRLVERVSAAAVVEPRHPSWFEQGVEAFLAERRVARRRRGSRRSAERRGSGWLAGASLLSPPWLPEIERVIDVRHNGRWSVTAATEPDCESSAWVQR